MKIPFQILRLTEDADDESVKKAYLAGVQRYSPDQSPREFQRIRAAYETIKNSRDRLSFRLFASSLPDADDICDILVVAEAENKPGPGFAAGIIKRVLQENMKSLKLPLEEKDG